MAKLERLGLRNNRLTKVESQDLPKNLKELDIYENPIISPPVEICEGGNLDYMRDWWKSQNQKALIQNTYILLHVIFVVIGLVMSIQQKFKLEITIIGLLATYWIFIGWVTFFRAYRDEKGIGNFLYGAFVATISICLFPISFVIPFSRRGNLIEYLLSIVITIIEVIIFPFIKRDSVNLFNYSAEERNRISDIYSAYYLRWLGLISYLIFVIGCFVIKAYLLLLPLGIGLIATSYIIIVVLSYLLYKAAGKVAAQVGDVYKVLVTKIWFFLIIFLVVLSIGIIYRVENVFSQKENQAIPRIEIEFAEKKKAMNEATNKHFQGITDTLNGQVISIKGTQTITLIEKKEIVVNSDYVLDAQAEESFAADVTDYKLGSYLIHESKLTQKMADNMKQNVEIYLSHYLQGSHKVYIKIAGYTDGAPFANNSQKRYQGEFDGGIPIHYQDSLDDGQSKAMTLYKGDLLNNRNLAMLRCVSLDRYMRNSIDGLKHYNPDITWSYHLESNKQKVTGLLRKVHIEMRMEAIQQIQQKEEEIKKEKGNKMRLYISITLIFVISLMVIVYLSFRMIVIAQTEEEHKTRKMVIHIIFFGLSIIVFCSGLFVIIPFLFG